LNASGTLALQSPPRRSSGALQISLKIQNPVTSSATRSDRLATGSFSEKQKFPLRPEHLFAGVQKLLQRSGRSPDFWLRYEISEVIHSGATVRDSHPLPYSPRFYVGHLNVC
jgi:hypothetical protein